MLRLPGMHLRLQWIPGEIQPRRVSMETRARERESGSLRIGELARASGYSDRTLRYYEEIGLLRPNARTAAGYRLYAPDAIERLRFVKNAQSLGLRLHDIQRILGITDAGGTPCAHVLSVVDGELAQIRSQLERLEALRGELLGVRAKLAREIKRGRKNSGHGCGCVGEVTTAQA